MMSNDDVVYAKRYLVDLVTQRVRSLLVDLRVGQLNSLIDLIETIDPSLTEDPKVTEDPVVTEFRSLDWGNNPRVKKPELKKPQFFGRTGYVDQRIDAHEDQELNDSPFGDIEETGYFELDSEPYEESPSSSNIRDLRDTALRQQESIYHLTQEVDRHSSYIEINEQRLASIYQVTTGFSDEISTVFEKLDSLLSRVSTLELETMQMNMKFCTEISAMTSALKKSNQVLAQLKRAISQAPDSL